MKVLHVFLTLLLVVGFAANVAIAQSPPSEIPDPVSWSAPIGDIVSQLVSWYTFLYAAVIYVTGYLIKYVPGLQNVPSLAWTLLILAVLIGLAFMAMGASASKLLIPIFAQLNLYDLVLKFIFGRSRPATE